MRIVGLLKKHGLLGLAVKFIEKKTEPVDLAYAGAYGSFLPNEEELRKEREKCRSFSYAPKISIVVPLYKTPERFFGELVQSVLAQTYENWELCLVDAGVEWSIEGEPVKAWVQDPRIRYRKTEENKGISVNTNIGVEMAEGEYIAFLDHDDILSANALYEVVSRLQTADRAALFYSDEDKTNESMSAYFEPHFKPDFNEELLNHYNYICHFLVVKKALFSHLGGLDARYDGAQDYDFVLKCTEQLAAGQIVHIPKILYHWRVHGQSTAGNAASKNYAYDAGIRAVQSHMERIGRDMGTGESSVPKAQAVKGQEYVGIARTCRIDMSQCRIFLGDNCKPQQKDWFLLLASHFDSETGHAPVGMVGGKLLTDAPLLFGRVISCGYTFLADGTPVPLFENLAAFKKGYYRRACVAQDISACSLDFCVVLRSAYEKVGGVNGELPRPYRDLDFAFRLRRAGYRVILDAGVTAKEKRTEGTVLLKSQKEPFSAMWEEYLRKGDPFWHEYFRGDGKL